MLESNRLARGACSALVYLSVVNPLSAINIWINEIHYDNTGADSGEFIEIAGLANTNLAAYSLILYNGATGQSYGSITLSGLIPNQSNGFGALSFTEPGIQNGSPDGLYLSGPSGSQFLSYEGSFTATNGPAISKTSSDIGVMETGSTLLGHSLQLAGHGSSLGDFAWTGPTTASPGAINAGQSFASQARSIPDEGPIMAVFIVAIAGVIYARCRAQTRGET